MRKQLGFGLLTMAIYFISSRLFNVPDIIAGLLLGLSLCFLCLGFLPEKAHEAIKTFKRRLFHQS